MCLRGQFGARKGWGKVLFLLLVVCLSSGQLLAQLPHGAGRVFRLSGQVSVVRNGDLWSLRQTDNVAAGQEIVTGPDGHAEIELEDGSRFEVFPDSRVVFRANRGDWRDLLDIFLGKVKVHIEKLGGRPNPYRVNSPTALIAVRGTTFEVAVEPNDTTVVSVVEGLVGVQHKVHPGKEIFLKDGETLRIVAAEPLAVARPSRMQTVGRILEAVADRAAAITRRGIPAPGGTPVPGAPPGSGPAGTPVPGTSGTGSTGPPSSGRPGDIPDGDTGPGTTIPPATGGSGTPPAPPKPTPPPPRKGGGNQ